LTLLAIFNIASLMKTACICLLIEGIDLTWKNFFCRTYFERNWTLIVRPWIAFSGTIHNCLESRFKSKLILRYNHIKILSIL